VRIRNFFYFTNNQYIKWNLDIIIIFNTQIILKNPHFYETKEIDEMWGKDYGNENLILRKTIKLSEVPFMPLYENFMSLHACSNVWE